MESKWSRKWVKSKREQSKQLRHAGSRSTIADFVYWPICIPKVWAISTSTTFTGFMVKLKFKSLIANVAEEKTSDALIDSGATHHFFHRRSAFIVHTDISHEDVFGATGDTKVVGNCIVRIPIGQEILVQAYHVPIFSSNILSVGFLSKNYEFLFPERRYGLP